MNRQCGVVALCAMEAIGVRRSTATDSRAGTPPVRPWIDPPTMQPPSTDSARHVAFLLRYGTINGASLGGADQRTRRNDGPLLRPLRQGFDLWLQPAVCGSQPRPRSPSVPCQPAADDGGHRRDDQAGAGLHLLPPDRNQGRVTRPAATPSGAARRPPPSSRRHRRVPSQQPARWPRVAPHRLRSHP